MLFAYVEVPGGLPKVLDWQEGGLPRHRSQVEVPPEVIQDPEYYTRLHRQRV